jgi:predicted hydrocarbon binding protein
VEEPVAEKDEVTSLALRVTVDSYEDILGKGGKNSILNYAMLKELIDKEPSYSEEIKYPQQYVDRIIRASVEVLGESGTRAIMIRAGRNTVKHAMENSPMIQQIAADKNISSIDKMKALLNYYAVSINRPPLIDIMDDRAVFHNPGCTLCDGIKAEKSYCTYVCGVFEGMAHFIAGLPNARCEEVVCKAKGDEECRYELFYKG